MTTRITVQTQNTTDPMRIVITEHPANARHDLFTTVKIVVPGSGSEVTLYPKHTLAELKEMFPTADVVVYPQEFVDNA